MSMRQRIVVSVMTLSAVGFIGIANREGFVGQAMVPTKNDRPTVGFGSTFHEDGSPVKMGDTVTPVRALVKAQVHVAKDEAVFRDSLKGASLHQAEFDTYMDWVYQYGTAAWLKSSMRKHVLDGNYTQACNALLAYKYSGGYDCSIPGNKVCSGVWKRQLERHNKCMGAQ